MGLNKHMMLEEHDLEQEIAELTGEGGWDDDYAWEERDPPTAADLARAAVLQRRLVELRAAQRSYNQYLGGVADRKPSPGASPRFADHVAAFERIRDADNEAT